MHRLAIVSLLISCLLPAAVVVAEWQGEMKQVEGVTTVLNPESPAGGETVLALEELWRVGGDDEDIMFGVIAELLHDEEENIYVVDGQICEIQVFSPDGELLRTIGRQGEGPGEFVNATDMFWAPGGQLAVIQAWPGKIVQIRPDGTPGDLFPLPFREGGGFQTASRGVGVGGDRTILSGTAWTTEEGQQLQLAYLKAYDAQRNEVATYVETSRETRFGNWTFREEKFVDFQRRWDAAPDGRVAAALSFEDYRIHVWNADGTVDRVIERPDYEAVERNDREKAIFQSMYDRFTRWNPGSTFEISDTHQAVAQVTFRDDGMLWVQSGRDMYRGSAGVQVSYDVYDQEGRYARKVQLALDADPANDALFFVGDRVYVVTDLFSAVMARFGSGEQDERDELDIEPEPVAVVAYRIPAERLNFTRVE